MAGKTGLIPSNAYLTGLDYARGQQAAKQNEGLPIVGSGILGNIAGGFGSALLGGLGDAATFFGFNNAGDFLNRGAEYFEERMKPAMPADFSWNYLTSPEGLARGFGNLTGSIASILAPTALIPGGGVVGAGGRILTSLPNLYRIGSKALRAPAALARMNGLKNVPNIGMGTANWAIRGGMTAPMEASMEAGNYLRNAIANGEDPETARQKAMDIFKENTALLSASNAAQFGLASKVFRGNGWKTRLGAAAVEPPIQAHEEGEQEAFQLKAQGLPYTYNPYEMITNPRYAQQYQAMLEGLLPTTALSALGFTGGSLFGNRNQNRNSQKQNPPVQENPPAQTQPQNISSDDGNLINWAENISGSKNTDTIIKVIDSAKRHGVDPRLALAVATAESNINQGAGSPAGAIGVMQLMPETAEGLGVNPYDEDENIEGGMKFLKRMLDRYNGNWKLATAAYNAGQGNVKDHVPENGETEHYVARIQGILEGQPEYSDGENSRQQGNTLKILPQSGKECTLEAMAAIYNAYTGENTTASDWGFSGSNWWYGNLKNGKLQAKEYNFSSSEREQFEQTIKDHFDKHPNNPIFLYQAGGAGSSGNHSLNRVSGTHATVIGRRLDNGKYQVFDSNGGMTHELELSEIFDPTSNGGDSL